MSSRRSELELLAEMRMTLREAIRELNRIGRANRPPGEQRRLEQGLVRVNERITELMRYRSSQPSETLDGPPLSEEEKERLNQALNQAHVSSRLGKQGASIASSIEEKTENRAQSGTPEPRSPEKEPENLSITATPEMRQPPRQPTQARIEILSIIHLRPGTMKWIEREDAGAGTSASPGTTRKEREDVNAGTSAIMDRIQPEEPLLEVLRESPERESPEKAISVSDSSQEETELKSNWSDYSDPELRELMDMSTLFIARKEPSETLLDRQERAEHERILRELLESPVEIPTQKRPPIPDGIALTSENIHLYDTDISDWDRETLPNRSPEQHSSKIKMEEWDWPLESKNEEDEWSEEDEWPLSLWKKILETPECSVPPESEDSIKQEKKE